MANKLPCYIWSTPAEEAHSSNGQSMFVNSPRAGGLYTITGTATSIVGSLTALQRAALTTWLCDQRKAGTLSPVINSDVIEVAKSLSPLSTGERVERTLLFVNENLRIGERLLVTTADNEKRDPLAFNLCALTECLNKNELISFLELLSQMGYLDAGAGNMVLKTFKPSAKGWLEIDRLRKTLPSTTQAFVAMWFNPSTEDAYRVGIEPAITDSGYRAVRIDNKEHVNKIDDEIIAEIRRSKFLVADFTSEPKSVRGGVYFEAGFAMGLRIPVIWTCSEASKDDLHFDTRQYNHIIWKTTDDLRKALRARIDAVLGDGPLLKR